MDESLEMSCQFFFSDGICVNLTRMDTRQRESGLDAGPLAGRLDGGQHDLWAADSPVSELFVQETFPSSKDDLVFEE